MPSIAGDSRTPLVLGLDIRLRHDFSAVVAVSRHPTRSEDVAIRAVHVFRPTDMGGTVDLDAVEQFIRQKVSDHNVVMLAYDEWQAASIAQRLQRDAVVWPSPSGRAQNGRSPTPPWPSWLINVASFTTETPTCGRQS